MAIDPRISLAAQAPDIGRSISNALVNTQRIQQIGQQREQAPLQNQLLQQRVASGDLQATQDQENARITSIVTGFAELAPALASGDMGTVVRQLGERRARLVAEGTPTNDTDEAFALLSQPGGLEQLQQSSNEAIQLGQQLGILKPAGGVRSAGQREFESKLSGLTDKQKKEAVLIDLGLSPRAVGSAAITIADEDLTDLVANSQAVIKQRGKFGEMTGASRAKTIDKGFERINGIDAGIRNIDKAIAALDEGASTGFIQQFLPSIRASSVKLNQIQGEMALDVVGAVTFGALSKGELDLASNIALPKGLNSTELKQWLIDKKAAQGKLRAYFGDQIQFLDQGGTVAGFIRDQERKQTEFSPDAGLISPPAEQATAQPAQQQILRFDAQGNLIQ